MGYGQKIIQNDLNFVIEKGEVMIIMGGSGCGKSTLLRHLIGLEHPKGGRIVINGRDLWQSTEAEREEMLRGMGVLFQGSGLWGSMTLRENIALPLKEYTKLGDGDIRELAELKLQMVGLGGFGDYYPAEISGGMQKRAGLARALALDPEILLFDEPSAGLDPVSARRLDDLIIELNRSLGTTIVVVTHDLDSIFAIGSDAVFLDARSKSLLAKGSPRELLDFKGDPYVRYFLTRCETLDR